MSQEVENVASTSRNELFFLPRKGGVVLLYNGYQFYCNKKFLDGKSSWACSNKKKEKCRGTIHLKNSQIMKCNHHICKQNKDKNDIDLQLHKMRREACEDTSKPMKQIYDQHVIPLRNAGLDLITNIPKFTSVKTGLYNNRKKTAQVSKLVYRVPSEIEIPPQFHDFKLFEYHCDEKCIIAFCSQEAKERIGEINTFFADGTFHSCPAPCEQLFTVHGDFGSTTDCLNVVPMIYVLMTDRQTETYVALFDVLKTCLPEFYPLQMMTDYEPALMNALQRAYPRVILKGCHYHFARAVFRNAKTFGNITKGQNEKRIVALATALPFLPAHLIWAGWEYILDDLYDSDNTGLHEFKKYMERQWLTSDHFIRKWSVHGELLRTNNCLEGWHGKLNELVGRKKRPNLLKLLSILKNDSDLNVLKMMGGILEKRNKKTIVRDEFVYKTNVMLDHADIAVGFFLERMSWKGLMFK